MKKFKILTLHPEIFSGFIDTSIIKRAISNKQIQIELQDIRNHSINKYGQVDDTPYGGGSGMLLRADSLVPAIKAAKKDSKEAPVVLLTPQAKPFTQKDAAKFISSYNEIILVSPRYEGVDERIVQEYVDYEVSMGDYVLMGGEVPAMAFIEATSRLIPGVLGNENSIEEESYSSSMLEYSQYTKPQKFEEREVPPILLSGDHEKIKAWREEQSTQKTIEKRPDLLKNHSRKSNIYLSLVHYPVVDREGDIITSSITNIDIHDISRSSTTYDIDIFYITHPTKTMRALSNVITKHWLEGYGKTYNPNRSEALERAKVVYDIDDAISDIEKETGKTPILISTSAVDDKDVISFEKARAIINTSDKPILLLLGTGWGLAPEVLNRAKYRIEPIKGPGDFNHLSVRAAAAIILDRLFG